MSERLLPLTDDSNFSYEADLQMALYNLQPYADVEIRWDEPTNVPSIWLMALRCSTCNHPMPRIVTLLAPMERVTTGCRPLVLPRQNS